MRKIYQKNFLLFYFLIGLFMPPYVFSDEAKEPTKLLLRVDASSDVNLDQNGRPAPIKIRIYELKDSAGFLEADYFTLDGSDKTLLAPDMLAKDEFILKPGESKIIERDSKYETVAIGVLAGYRELEKVNWRAIYKLKESPEQAW